MDTTQRGIVGTLGAGALIGGVALAYADSPIGGAVLAFVGAVAFIAAVPSPSKQAESAEPGPPPAAPMAPPLAPEFSHLVAQPTRKTDETAGPVPADIQRPLGLPPKQEAPKVDREQVPAVPTDSPVATPPLTGPALAQARELIRQQLDAFRESGGKISMAAMAKVQDRGRPWQEEVIRYLSETFVDPLPAVQFDQIDTPITGQPPVVGLGQRIGEQVAYLGTLKDTLGRYELKP